jgi:Ras-related protein Rab-6A
VTLEEATSKSQSLNIMFMETSAKAGHNVKSLFKKIAMSLPGMEKDSQNSDAQNASRSTFDVNHHWSPL